MCYNVIRNLFQFRNCFSFRKYSLLKFRIVTLLDTMIQSWLKNMSLPMILRSLNVSSTLRDEFTHMYFISWAKVSAFLAKWTPGVFVDYWPPYWWTTDSPPTRWRCVKRFGKLLITQKQCTAQTWELKSWFIYLSLQHFKLLACLLDGFEFVFCCVTIKTIQTCVHCPMLFWQYCCLSFAILFLCCCFLFLSVQSNIVHLYKSWNVSAFVVHMQ